MKKNTHNKKHYNQTIKDLFTFNFNNKSKYNNRNTFYIPDYQRQYSWVTKNIEELWKDFYTTYNDNKKENENWVNDFGNLALLAYGTNTKMQNATPYEKANYFNENLQEYSLKLQIMTLLTLESDSKKWERNKCIELREALIKLLIEDNKKKE